MIFPLLLCAQLTQRVQFLKAVDVIVRNIRGCLGCRDGTIASGFGFVHSAVEFPRCLRQLAHRGNGIIFRCLADSDNASSQRSYGGHAQHDRTDSAAEHRSHIKSLDDLGNGGIGCQCCRCATYHAGKGCNAFYESRIVLNILTGNIERVCTRVVEIAQRRCKGIAYGNFQVGVGVLHHVQLGLCCGVAFVCLVRQGDVLIPRGIRRLHGAVHFIRSQSEGFEHIALANAGQTEILQNERCAFSTLIQIAKSADECCEGAQSVRIPLLLKLIRRHSRDICEAL